MHIFDTNIHYIIRIDIFYSKMSMKLDFEMAKQGQSIDMSEILDQIFVTKSPAELNVLLLRTTEAKSRARDKSNLSLEDVLA